MRCNNKTLLTYYWLKGCFKPNHFKETHLYMYRYGVIRINFIYWTFSIMYLSMFTQPSTERVLPPIEAIVLFGEPVRWETNLQLILDVLMTDGQLELKPLTVPRPHIPILGCNMDLLWMAEAHLPRLVSRFGSIYLLTLVLFFFICSYWFYILKNQRWKPLVNLYSDQKIIIVYFGSRWSYM